MRGSQTYGQSQKSWLHLGGGMRAPAWNMVLTGLKGKQHCLEDIYGFRNPILAGSE